MPSRSKKTIAKNVAIHGRYIQSKMRQRIQTLVERDGLSIEEATEKVDKQYNAAKYRKKQNALLKQARKERGRELQEKANVERNTIIQCPICAADIAKKNRRKHIKKVHPKVYKRIFPSNNKKRSGVYIRIVSGGGGPGTGKGR